MQQRTIQCHSVNGIPNKENSIKSKQKEVRQRPQNTVESLLALNSAELCEEVRGGQQNTRLGH